MPSIAISQKMMGNAFTIWPNMTKLRRMHEKEKERVRVGVGACVHSRAFLGPFNAYLYLAWFLLRVRVPVSSIYGHSMTGKSQKDEKFLFK